MRYKEVFADGFKIPAPPTDLNCEPCSKSKSVHRKPSPTYNKAEKPFELIHTDLHGPFPCKSAGGKHYFVVFVDDATRFIWVRFLAKKSDLLQEYTNFLTFIRTQFDANIKRIRSDNGGEYTGHGFEELNKKHGIVHEFTPPYSHESNGLAERVMRTLLTIVRSMVAGAKTP